MLSPSLAAIGPAAATPLLNISCALAATLEAVSWALEAADEADEAADSAVDLAADSVAYRRKAERMIWWCRLASGRRVMDDIAGDEAVDGGRR